MARQAEPVAVLSDPEAAPSLAACLAPLGPSVTWYASMEDLVRGRRLSSIAVLVVHCRRFPRGTLLVALGRLNLEYPCMQKVALMEGPPPIPIAEYLTACGVDLVWDGSGEERIERLTSVVDRLQDRSAWVVA